MTGDLLGSLVPVGDDRGPVHDVDAVIETIEQGAVKVVISPHVHRPVVQLRLAFQDVPAHRRRRRCEQATARLARAAFVLVSVL
jgi:hypothetical protein